MKRISYLYWGCFILNLLLTVIVFFFLKEFLFVVSGYDTSLLKMNSSASVKAYHEVSDMYLPANIAMFIFALTIFVSTGLLKKRISKKFHRRYIISGIICSFAFISVLTRYSQKTDPYASRV